MHTALRCLIILRFISIFYFRNLKITPANIDIIILQIIHYLLMRLSCPKNPFLSLTYKKELFLAIQVFLKKVLLTNLKSYYFFK